MMNLNLSATSPDRIVHLTLPTGPVRKHLEPGEPGQLAHFTLNR